MTKTLGLMKKILTTVLLLVGLFSFSQNGSFEERMEYGDNQIDSKNYKEAIIVFEKLLTEQPKNVRALNNAGRAYFNSKNFEKAKEKFRLAALYASPDDKEDLALYYSNLSASYTYLNDDEKAYQYAMKAYLMNEDSEQNLWNAASNAQNFQKCEEAIKLMDKAKIDKKNHFNSLYGRCYKNLGDYEKSIKSFTAFFDNYVAEDDFVMFDIDEEKYVYLGSQIALIIKNLENDENLQYKASALKLINEMSKSGKRYAIFEKLFDNDLVWEDKESAKLILREIFKNIDKPTLSDNIYLYYYLKDYKKTLELTNKFLQGNLDSDELRHGRLYDYLASYQLLLQDFKKNNKINEAELNAVATKYKNVFSEHKDYNRPDLENKKELQLPIMKTLTIAKKYFDSPEEQKKVAPIVIKILNNTPHTKFKKELNEFLSKGVLEN